MKNKPFITGLHGCSCHPFDNWADCMATHKQIFKVGASVKNRCSGREGVISEVNKDYPFFYIIKYGPKPCDHHLIHSAQLAKN